ncbi:MAG: DUF711 family protein, partial [Anaerolineales bacterium]|nr:DUF711 family protein [Anaerolineales bacterium]
MKIRSITYFLHPGCPLDESELRQAGDFMASARPAFEAAGYSVQTTRLATVPFPDIMPALTADRLIEYARALEEAALALGFEYVSLGPALPDRPESYPLIPEVIGATRSVFLAGLMTLPEGGVSLRAVRSCAEIIQRASSLTPDGFANLRFAALANVPPGAPFFPAAYHAKRQPAFALATEAADLAVEAFSQAGSLEQGCNYLVQTVETHAGLLHQVAQGLSSQFGVDFGGIDFTLAPFPQEALSFGTAMQRLGVPSLGEHGSLAAAAILADTLDRADYVRVGFNGLMLPVLEDAALAKYAALGTLTVRDLLLYSAVCGTGLDTIPLPGDATSGQLNAILLDLAALAQRLDKPLTARLMPIPG